MSKKSKRKTNLKSAILLLLLMAILLVTSSYAWFTANQTVTISSLEVNVKATNGLQISVDGQTWKSIITAADITGAAYGGATNIIPKEMAPVSTIGTVTDGKLDMYYGSVVTNDAGDFILTSAKDTDDSGHYIVFDVFLKVDSATDIYLTSESKVDKKEGATDQGLQNAARVGFVIEGNTASTSSIGTITGLSLDTGTAKIWEPNYDTHTDLAITNAKTNYDLTITKTNAQLDYYGLKADITAGNNIGIKQVGVPSTQYFSKVDPAISTIYGSTEKPKFDNLKAGITKVRVYMWVEGQDVDCENGASGTDIVYTVQFSTQG